MPYYKLSVIQIVLLAVLCAVAALLFPALIHYFFAYMAWSGQLLEACL